MKNTPYWHVFNFLKCYFLKRKYLKIENPGIKNILQALTFVLFAQKSWNFTVTCILSYWRTSACQIWVIYVFSFLWGEKGLIGITPWCRGFSKKGVLCWKVFWWKPVEKNVLCYLAQPPGKPLIGPRPKNTFFAHHISLDYFVKNLSMYLYDFFRYVTFYEKWHFSWIAPYYHLKKLNVLKTLSFSFMP